MSARSLRQDFLRAPGGSVGAYLFGTALAQCGWRRARAIMVFSSLLGAMMTVMAPEMASLLYQREDIAGLGALAVAPTFSILISTLCIAGCLWIFRETLLALAFGRDYRAAAPQYLAVMGL